MGKNIRISFPEDVFIKRQFTYLGDIAHELNQFPGKYIGSENNEYPDANGSVKRADIVYSVEMNDGTINIINIEDETSYVNKKTLIKSYKYKTNIFYKNELPVISIITTTIPHDKCLNELWISQTDLFKPIIKSFPAHDSWEKLNNLLNKAKNDEEFTSIEGLELINMPRYCTENQAEAVKLICDELPNLKIKDNYVKNELIYSMQCMIHKYAKTDEYVVKLEEMIGLKQDIEVRSPVLDNMRRQGVLQGREEGFKKGREEGLEEGREEGREEGLEKGREEGIVEGIGKGMEKGREEGILYTLNELANDSDNNYDIEKLAHKFGYTVKEITDVK